MPIEVTIDAYLSKLKSEEAYRGASERKSVPTYSQLAEEANVSPVTLSRLVNGHTELTNLKIIDSIITSLRKRGFSADINDMLKYYPPLLK